MSEAKQQLSSPSRLLWQCRRGMLELEILLRDFVQHDYVYLSDNMKLQFEDLLTVADPVLFDYLMGKEEPDDDGLRAVVQTIRKAARQRLVT
jgi:antitoxin CptB